MTVYDYTNKPQYRNGRVYRVVRVVNGKTIQRYFSADQYDRAVAMDKFLALQQQRYPAHDRYTVDKETRSGYTVTNPLRLTDVIGLTLDFHIRSKTGGSYYPTITIVCTRLADNIRVRTSRSISKRRNYPATWLESCQVLSQSRGLDNIPDQWLAAIPPLEQWEALRKYYINQLKHTLSINVLDLLRY